MEWPGEKLLGQLWETLAEKGVGSLMKPGQTRREGLVALELDRAKKLADAQTERDVENIRLGRSDLADFSMRLDFAGDSKKRSGVVARKEPTFDYEEAIEASRLKLLDESVRHQINVEKSILHAEESLRMDDDLPPEDKIDEDWLYRWRDYTGGVSNDELQRLWGRLLAGEVKAPGTFSLRCLDFLRNLSQSEAKLIESVSKLVISNVIWRPKKGEGYELPLTFSDLLDLQDLGVLTGVDSTGLNFSLGSAAGPEADWIRVLDSHGKCVIIRSDDKSAVLRLNIYSVTKLGLQVISLGRFEPDMDYLKSVATHVRNLGYRVAMADLVSNVNGYISWRNEAEIA